MVKQVINHLKSQDVSFVVAGNGETCIKKSSDTIDVASKNHKESATLMCYCLELVDFENKVTCVKSNDTDVNIFFYISNLVAKVPSLNLNKKLSNLLSYSEALN